MQQRDTLRSASTNNASILGHKHSSSTLSAPPEHLSEFYSFMNNKSNLSLSPNQSPNVRDFLQSNKRITRQPSLNTFTSFTPSVLDLPNIINSKDFENSIQTYETMLSKAEKLRNALLLVSEAANEFGQSLEDTINLNPKVNNSKQVSDGLINAGSLQYIVGSNNQILSRLLLNNFQQPLKEKLEELKNNYETNHRYYQQEVRLKSKILRAKELENIKLSKLKTRNLTTYKNNLMNLTNQLDEIDRLKYDYYHDVNSMMEEFNQNQLLIKTGSIIRAELELFEGIARKGWSGGGLDQLLSISPDLFAINEDETHLFDNYNMDNIAEDNESLISDMETEDMVDQNNIEPKADETVETVKLHTRSDSRLDSIKNLDISTPRNEELEDDIKDMDESFSLPKINGHSLVNSQGKSDGSFNNDDILNELDD